jgi:hypothetical protein
MSGLLSDSFTLEVACGPRAARTTREALRTSDRIGSAIDDAVLLASELVTHVVLRATRAETMIQAETMIHVRASVDRNELVISVRDPSCPASLDAEASGEDPSREDHSREDRSREDRSREDGSREDRSREDGSREDGSWEDRSDDLGLQVVAQVADRWTIQCADGYRISAVMSLG